MLSLNCNIEKVNGRVSRNLGVFCQLGYGFSDNNTLGGCSRSKPLTVAKGRIMMNALKGSLAWLLNHSSKFGKVFHSNSQKELNYLGFPEGATTCM